VGVRRVTIQEATRILGLSEGAVRKRVKRGTLAHERTEDGRIWVELDASSTGVDEVLDDVAHPHSDVLISELRERVAFLERELEVRSDEIRRRDTIIMNMTEAMKAIPPRAEEEPPEPRESSETPTEHLEREATPTPEKLSWWRRWFGG
jgi:hypothetical protein